MVEPCPHGFNPDEGPGVTCPECTVANNRKMAKASTIARGAYLAVALMNVVSFIYSTHDVNKIATALLLLVLWFGQSAIDGWREAAMGWRISAEGWRRRAEGRRW